MIKELLPRPAKKTVIHLSIALSSALSGCASAQGLNTEPPVTPKSSPTRNLDNHQMGAIYKETYHLTQGPHTINGAKNGVLSSIDVSVEGGLCPSDGKRMYVGKPTLAPVTGDAVRVGDNDNRSDPNHSILEIQKDDGDIVGIMHLDHIPSTIKVGQRIVEGQAIGEEACEQPYSAVGNPEMTGPHNHIYVKDKDGKAMPITGWGIDGYIISDQGYLIAPDGSKRVATADGKHCGPDQASINVCKGIRNDMEPSRRLLLATSVPTIALKEATVMPPITPTFEAVTPRTVATLTPTPLVDPQPSPRVRPTPVPTDGQIAANLAINNFIGVFSQRQMQYESSNSGLSMNLIKNSEYLLPERNISQADIIVSWRYLDRMKNSVETYHDPFAITGESNIKNIDFNVLDSVVYPTTSAEYLNGRRWLGTVEISFNERFRALVGPKTLTASPNNINFGEWRKEKVKVFVYKIANSDNTGSVWGSYFLPLSDTATITVDHTFTFGFDIPRGAVFPVEPYDDCMKKNGKNEKYCQDQVKPITVPLMSISDFAYGYRLMNTREKLFFRNERELKNKCSNGCGFNTFWFS